MSSATQLLRPTAIAPARRSQYYAGYAACVVGIVASVANLAKVVTWSFEPVLVLIAAVYTFGGGYLMITAQSERAPLRDAGDSSTPRRDQAPSEHPSGAPILGVMGGDPDSSVRIVHVIRVRCGLCAALNEESARYCSSCGGLFPAAGSGSLRDP